MRKRTQQTLAVLLSLVLLISAAPLSFAEDTAGNTLTINLATIEEYANDIITASVQADLYLITTSKPDENYDTYNFDPFGTDGYGTEFEELQEAFDAALIPNMENPNDGAAVMARFSPLAESFAEIILAEDYEREPIMSVPADGASTIVVEGLPDGLYLLVLRGDFPDKTGTGGYVTTIDRDGETRTLTRAHSGQYEYLFDPQLVTLPAKTDGDAQQYNTGYGTWTDTLTVNIKVDREKRLGNLIISKTLEDYLDESRDPEYMEPAIFVFDVIGRASEDETAAIIYRRQVAFSFDGPGTKTETLSGIPVGTWIWIEEVYTGAHYRLKTAGTLPVQVIAAPAEDETDSPDEPEPEEEVQTVEIIYEVTNAGDNTHRGGHGIENTFTYQAGTDENGAENGTWTGGWTTEPESAVTGGKV